jgi:hypothetical protein
LSQAFRVNKDRNRVSIKTRVHNNLGRWSAQPCMWHIWWRDVFTVLVEKSKRDNLEDVDINGSIMLRDNVKKQNGGYGQGQVADYCEHIYKSWITINQGLKC